MAKARAKAGSKDFHDDEKLENQKSPEEERRREAEKLLQQRFKTFDLHFKDIVSLLDAWDRSQGNIFRQPSPSEKSEHEDANALASNKKNKNQAKGNPKEKEKEKEKKNDKADKVDVAEKADKGKSP